MSVSARVARIARVAGEAGRIVELAERLELDRKVELLDAAGALLDQVTSLLLLEQTPGDGTVRVLTLVRVVQVRRTTMARECETALRDRALRTARAAS